MKSRNQENHSSDSGYKQTEVGVIPTDWESTRVNNVASSARNAIVGGPFGSDLVSSDYVDEGVPVIRGQNMNSKWITGDFVFVTSKKAALLEANLARPGDIVFTQRGTLGQVSVAPDTPYERYLVSQSQMKITLNQDIADPIFYYYLFSGEHQQAYIRQNTIQTGVPHINLGILRSIPIPRPPLPEQRVIAAALSDVDALIASLDKLIAKKRDMKQGAMQQLLTGKRRLPGFGKGHGYKQTVVGLIPEDWGTASGIEMTTLISKGASPKWQGFAYTSSGMLFVTSENVREGFLDLKAPKYLPLSFHDRLKRTKLRKGDILINLVGGSIGRTCQITSDLGEANVNQAVAVFRVNEWHWALFVSYYFQSSTTVARILEMQVDAARPNISLGDLRRFSVALPPLSEQRAIATVLSNMDAEIAAMEARRDKTKLLKQGMMQELLTGRIRLI